MPESPRPSSVKPDAIPIASKTGTATAPRTSSGGERVSRHPSRRWLRTPAISAIQGVSKTTPTRNSAPVEKTPDAKRALGDPGGKEPQGKQDGHDERLPAHIPISAEG